MAWMSREELIISPPTCIATIPAHTRWVDSVAFHPKLPLLASGSTDKTIKLWDCSQNPPTLKADLKPEHTERFHH